MGKLEDIVLKQGDVITFRDGERCGVLGCMESLIDYSSTYGKEIIEVKRPVKYETIYQKPPEILDKEEKEYLSAVIRPFKDKVVYIIKHTADIGEWIDIYLKDGGLSFPDFDKGTMYKGMEANKEYTLEELGL